MVGDERRAVCDPAASVSSAAWPSSRIVHVDESLVVVDKPAGLLAVPGRRDARCAAAMVARAYPDALIVHRLDQATSGLLVFARGAQVQRQLSRAFAERRVDKRYQAVVRGRPVDDAGRIELPLAVDWPQRPRRVVDAVRGKPSTTLWRLLATGAPHDPAHDRSRLELRPLTGRTHQLRLHLSAIGHPIVGDRLYGDRRDDVEPRLLLHAWRLELAHPRSGERLVLESAAPF